jgi:hypothetical protein
VGGSESAETSSLASLKTASRTRQLTAATSTSWSISSRTCCQCGRSSRSLPIAAIYSHASRIVRSMPPVQGALAQWRCLLETSQGSHRWILGPIRPGNAAKKAGMGPKLKARAGVSTPPLPAGPARLAEPVLEIDRILEKKPNRKIFFFLSRTKVPNCPL